MINRIIKLVKKRGFTNSSTRVCEELITRAYRREWVRKLVSVFYSRNLAKPDKWLFLVGCYNSGTTITQKVLSRHPDIATMPREGVRFTSVLPQPEDLGWPRMWLKCADYMEMGNSIETQKAGKIWHDWLPWWSKRASVFLEKSITNVTRMEWLDKNFPNAYFIGITRNGYCVAEGIRRKAKPDGHHIKELGSRYYDLSLTAQQWVLANQHLLEGKNKVQRYMQIQYEEFAEQPDEVLKKIFKFLEIAPIDVLFSNGKLLVNNTEFNIKNMNSTSLQNLSDQECEKISSVIYAMQSELGYPTENNMVQV